ncbi:hypothetical protein BDY19DRAFT_909154 [Irpex rosettiformis]|uniref:Uncharacterized protein n=1 Tax=Irpex rosettiformis TaxID=378272 RepID=A0ACB8TTI0_9APHY|nr:hypothetical protein BDY19DRAFT_909154 [Irpex rosettiformis]
MIPVHLITVCRALHLKKQSPGHAEPEECSDGERQLTMANQKNTSIEDSEGSKKGEGGNYNDMLQSGDKHTVLRAKPRLMVYVELPRLADLKVTRRAARGCVTAEEDKGNMPEPTRYHLRTRTSSHLAKTDSNSDWIPSEEHESSASAGPSSIEKSFALGPVTAAKSISLGPLPRFLAQCNSVNPCQVLAFFGMFVSRGLVFCTLHANGLTIVPMSYLLSHLHRQHTFICRQKISLSEDVDQNMAKLSRKAIIGHIAKHISECCSISMSQSHADEEVYADIEIAEPLCIPKDLSKATAPKDSNGSRDIQIRQYYHCPLPTCTTWVAFNLARGNDMSEVLRHIRRCCPKLLSKKDIQSCCTARYIQSVAISTPGKSIISKKLLLPKSWTPTASSTNSHLRKSILLPEPESDAAWVYPLGWDAVRTHLGEFSPTTLRSLIANPSSTLSSKVRGSKQFVEQGLCQVKRHVLRYLQESSQFVAAKPSRLREVLGRGQKTSSGTEVRKGLGHFELACSSDQRRAAEELLDLLLENKGAPQPEALQIAIHTLYQYLFIYSLGHGKTWTRAELVYHQCGALQIALLCICIQVARLDTLNQSHYTPWLPGEMDMSNINKSNGKDSEGAGDVADDEEDIDDQDDEQEDGQANNEELDWDLDLQDCCEGVEVGDIAALVTDTIKGKDSDKNSDHLTTILEFVHVNAAYISAEVGSTITPFNRLKTLGSNLYRSAQASHNATVTNSGSVVTIRYPQVLPVQLDTRRWSVAIIRSLVNFQDRLHAMLPPDFSLTTFPLQRLTDNHAHAALHKQRNNAEWLNPLRSSIREKLYKHYGIFTASRFNAAAAVSWLEADQATLRALAITFSLTAGVPPLQHQFRIRFDSIQQELRNIWLLPNRLVIWVNSFARPRDNNPTPALFVLPPGITGDFLFYLTIIRPMACEIVRSLSRDDSVYAIELWAHFRFQSAKQMHWSGREIAVSMESYTEKEIGMSLTPGEVRILVRSMLCHYFPDFITQTTDSIVDKAAQHTSMTSLANYGRIASLPPLPHFRFDQPLRFIALSQIWHAIMGIGPVNEAWRLQLQASGLLESSQALRLMQGSGLDLARSAIHQYGELCNKVHVRNLLQLRPFFSSEPLLGDSVLVQVTRLLTRKICQLQVNDPLTKQHCKADHVAFAICLYLGSCQTLY